MELEDDKLLLKDFPTGPLDHYRKQAKFDWKKMKFFIENPELLKTKVSSIVLMKNLSNSPVKSLIKHK